MSSEFSEDLKKIFYAGVGAIALSEEKAKAVYEELVRRGEIAVEHGKVVNEELKHDLRKAKKEFEQRVRENCKPTKEDVLRDLGKLSKEDLEEIKRQMNDMESTDEQSETAETANRTDGGEERGEKE